MAWSRPNLFKAAFLLCLLLLLLLNISYFRRKEIRSGILWPMPFHSELRTKDKYNNEKRTTNENASEQTLSTEHRLRNKKEQSNTTINHTKSILSTTNLKEGTFAAQKESALNECDNSSSLQNIHKDESMMTSAHTSFKSPFLSKLMTKFGLNTCPLNPPNLKGPIKADTEFESLSSIEKRFRDLLLPGGWYKPQKCNPKDRVAIVIPYRDRADHLPIFLKNIHSLLMKQQVEYGIFVIEQITDGLFNRAALMNVGFLEALKLRQWDCFIFHDVDLIPLDDRNLYRCPDQPRHMSVAVDTMGYK
ncbi:beta-1,4-N-acetylgalactosaminyltransferase bre-4-like [Contarinia nasturtii]|uniref:beta-1,4-N-acetylgalactosaminyltransferase bre-4-like n=1 Tax=Contarinia nasturtii TaxID=265458 RepID=UPI0012D41F2A|nr:beta-1,4-N-acetylgalactosaminyltransferase bre-4-like [Contarinia nasturtii]XP_031637694.1 beta-1,4-N-acetylgalactosaminyltransferase bre-4-like [Contarinia nasturtii]